MLGRLASGSEVLSFIPCATPTAPEGETDAPIAFAVVVIHKEGRILLMHNIQRNQWEIPGGGREAGEHPDDTARREVEEETCQRVETLHCQGLFKCRMQPDSRLEYGALYTGTIGDLLPFFVNNESDRITLWQPDSPLDDRFGDFSQIILKVLAEQAS